MYGSLFSSPVVNRGGGAYTILSKRTFYYYVLPYFHQPETKIALKYGGSVSGDAIILIHPDKLHKILLAS